VHRRDRVLALARRRRERRDQRRLHDHVAVQRDERLVDDGRRPPDRVRRPELFGLLHVLDGLPVVLDADVLADDIGLVPDDEHVPLDVRPARVEHAL